MAKAVKVNVRCGNSADELKITFDTDARNEIESRFGSNLKWELVPVGVLGRFMIRPIKDQEGAGVTIQRYDKSRNNRTWQLRFTTARPKEYKDGPFWQVNDAEHAEIRDAGIYVIADTSVPVFPKPHKEKKDSLPLPNLIDPRDDIAMRTKQAAGFPRASTDDVSQECQWLLDALNKHVRARAIIAQTRRRQRQNRTFSEYSFTIVGKNGVEQKFITPDEDERK